MKTSRLLIALIILFTLFNCTQNEEIRVASQKTGPLRTNCYIVYAADTKEAALIDVGGNIDSVITFISDKELQVKYILVTHCHPDHIRGIPVIK